MMRLSPVKLGGLLFLFSIFIACLQNIANASVALQPPTLLIENGAHQGRIGVSVADRDRTILATAGEDGTVRLWTMPGLHLKGILRSPPTEVLNNARFLAISPDGRFVAVANSFRGFLYDTQSMQIVRKILSPQLAGLAISPDNSQIAFGIAEPGCTLKVENLIDGRLIKRFCNSQVISAETTGLAFASNGLLAVSNNQEIELYDSGLARIATFALPDKSYTSVSLSFNNSASLLAVARDGDNPILVYDLGSRRLVPIDNKGLYGAEARATWSTDGTKLFGSGLMSETTKVGFSDPIYFWNSRDMSFGGVAAYGLFPQGPAYNRGKTLIYTEFFSTITASDGTRILAKGNVGAPEINLATNPQLPENYFGVSTDGTKVQLSVTDPITMKVKSFLSFDAANLIAQNNPSPSEALANWTDKAPGIVISGYAKRDYDLRINGLSTFSKICISSGCRRMPFNIIDGPATVAAADGMAVVGPPGVQMFDAKGVGSWFRGHWDIPVVSRLNISSDRRIVVAALRNGTLKWLDARNGKELLTAYVNPSNPDKWIAFTPSGYYAAGLNAEDLAGWEIDRGPGKTPDFFALSRFRAHFYRPDVVRLILRTLDEQRALKLADAAAGRREMPLALTKELPPVLRIMAPSHNVSVASAEFDLTLAWRCPSRRAVDRVSVLINGRPLKEIAFPTTAKGVAEETKHTIRVTLQARDNDITIIARADEQSSQPANLRVNWEGAPAASADGRKLYALIIGVSDYNSDDLKLDFAAKDAHDFGRALLGQKGGFYSDVEERVLTDHDTSRDKIVEGLQWLEASASSPHAVGILFLAGHGLTDEKQTYWFLPFDATVSNLRVKGVPEDEFRRTMQSITGKALWFIDTCHAGSATKRPVDVNGLLNKVTAPENGGIVTFASSTGSELSEERRTWQNGAFTRALVEGIEEGQAGRKDGLITTYLLESFIENRVQELTDGKQHPVMGRPPEQPDFGIAEAMHR